MAKMIEFMGACGNKCVLSVESIEYFQESNFIGNRCTLICFKSGKKIYIDCYYNDVKERIEEALADG